MTVLLHCVGIPYNSCYIPFCMYYLIISALRVTTRHLSHFCYLYSYFSFFQLETISFQVSKQAGCESALAFDVRGKCGYVQTPRAQSAYFFSRYIFSHRWLSWQAIFSHRMWHVLICLRQNNKKTSKWKQLQINCVLMVHITLYIHPEPTDIYGFCFHTVSTDMRIRSEEFYW